MKGYSKGGIMGAKTKKAPTRKQMEERQKKSMTRRRAGGSKTMKAPKR